MNTAITLLLCFLLAVDVSSTDDCYIIKRNCSKSLSKRVEHVCNKLLSSNQGQKRAISWMGNMDTYLHVKAKRQIADECCVSGCSDAHIIMYYCYDYIYA
ncbi:unnamed protein product [Chrysodeixis includens]|uniref:Uncharacterized protein n=1 Tax=Chrysodeixis includens TaxID=689277 RepID=A0A9N8L2V0_CHRIL|nr:unnamed protein product [Chrysodeixis includens]